MLTTRNTVALKIERKYIMAENTSVVRNVFDFVGKHWGEIYAAIDVIKGVFGKSSTPPENAPPEVKRVAGLFGTGDEIKFINHVLKLPKEDQNILLGLINYHFGPLNQPKTWLWTLVTFAQSNKWRKIITDLDSPAQKVGSKKVVTAVNPPNAANGVTTTTEEDLFRGEVENTQKFLQRLIEIVKTEEAKDGRTREHGYEAAVAYMRSQGIPLMPQKETMEWIDKNLPDLTSLVSKTSGLAQNWIHQQAEANRKREAAMPAWRRWFRTLIS